MLNCYCSFGKQWTWYYSSLLHKKTKYLGITLQPSAKCHTEHITEKVTQATRAMHEINFIRTLSSDIAMALPIKKSFRSYGIEVIWTHLNERNLATLERVKATYIKRVIEWQRTQDQTSLLPCTGNFPHRIPYPT